MAADSKAREELQHALVSYMAGDIRSFEFDDRISRLQSKKTTNDNSVRRISRVLWYIYDDFMDDTISVDAKTWAALQRVAAFLQTDLEAEEPLDKDVWPFHDQEEWRRHEWILGQVNLLEYNPAVHCHRVHTLWHSPVTIVAIGILLGLVIAVMMSFLRS